MSSGVEKFKIAKLSFISLLPADLSAEADLILKDQISGRAGVRE
jgi:hypothetical protein